MNKRSQDDEDLIDCIAKATPGSEKVYIIDVRPRVSVWGGGGECVCGVGVWG